MEIKEKIFKAYDIRGIYPEEINESVAYKIGEAFSEIYGKKEIVVGHDARKTSPKLTEEIMKAIENSGLNPVHIGLVSSDQFYVHCVSNKVPGIMVTASHNPAEYNGFKMLSEKGEAIRKTGGMEELSKKIIEKERSTPKNIKGSRRSLDITSEFIEKINQNIPSDSIKPISLVIDAGNGAVGPVLEKLIPLYKNITVKKLFWEPDGNFPNRSPDPLKKGSLDALKKEVLNTPNSFGVSFDGDGDRVFAVDEDGNFVDSDFLGTLLTKYFLEQNPEEKIINDITVSKVLSDTVSQYKNAKTIIERVGHSFIKKTMKETNSVLGVEKSGHFYFRSMYRADSGIMAVLYLICYLSKKNNSLKEELKPLRNNYFLTGQINLTTEKDPISILDNVTEKYKDKKITKLDGIAINSDEWRFILRSSNTEPIIRLVAEASSKKLLDEKVKEVIDFIDPYSVVYPD